MNQEGRRTAGILLHITSLPGNGASGDLGGNAYRYVDFLQAAGMGIWQMLPIGPTQADGSPYQTISVHAGNPELIDLAPLVEEGWLPPGVLDRSLATGEKAGLLAEAWRAFDAGADAQAREALDRFIGEESYWLEDYALFRVLHQANGERSWWEWPAALRRREPRALGQARRRLREPLAVIRFQQFNFYR
ncbi:MAG TPA: 4-alpha-glucanotransferase, partial [Sedimenticola sp.]|nr:4-alpha-glucanotransferase [Sedimenticola sp.]